MKIYGAQLTGSIASNGNPVVIGSLTVTGNLTAQQFIISSSVTHLTESFSSGSHKFGDSSDDIHTFTGSMVVSGSVNPLTVGSNLLYVSSSGNVGIGTSSPNYTLHIDSNTTTSRFQITNSTTGQVGAVGLQILQIGNDSSIVNRSNGYLSFETVGTERMRITSTGNVGIGTTSPGEQLTLSRSSYPTVKLIETTDSFQGYLQYHSDANEFRLVTVTNHPLIFSTNDTERMRITSGGNVGIGTNSPSEKLHVYGGGLGPEVKLEGTFGSFYIRVYNDNFNIYTPQGRNAISIANNGNVYNYSNTTSWQTTSDIRVKENINTIENALNVITSLNPVSFNYKQEFAEKNNWDDTMKLNNIGFIAQEFENVFPKYVYTKEYTLGDTPIEDFKSIDTGHLVPYLVKAIQELSTDLTSAKQEIELLKLK
jgi:hypothetical protein